MRIKMFALIGLLILSILLVSGMACGVSGPTMYQLTTVMNGQGNVSPSSGAFIAGDSVTLTAVPASGWSFSHWGGHGNGSQNPITIAMNSDRVVYVYFEEVESTTVEMSYDMDKVKIQNAVTAYMCDNKGELPCVEDELGPLRWFDCFNQDGFDCYAVSMCKLCPTYLNEVPASCVKRPEGDVLDNCNFWYNGWYKCEGCRTSSHYVWMLDASGNVYSVFIIDENNSLEEDGYQGVYP